MNDAAHIEPLPSDDAKRAGARCRLKQIKGVGGVGMRLQFMGVVAAAAAVAVTGCGSAATPRTSSVGAGIVSVAVTSPTGGSVIAANNVTVRGTVSPPNAVVQIQGQPAAVGNGVFTGTATLHGGKTTIDVIGSAPGATPGATSVAVTQQSSGSGGSQQSSSGDSASGTSTVGRSAAITLRQPAPPSVSSTSQAFYSPSGNVSCSIQSESAQCSVASADLTFILPQGGGIAYTIPGLSVPQGAGSEAPYNTQRADGAIVCEIPPSSSPAGITCQDTASRHGFQASRIGARQSVY
jgi:hypothetical protein